MSPERGSGPHPPETEHSRLKAETEHMGGSRHARRAESGGLSVADIAHNLEEQARDANTTVAKGAMDHPFEKPITFEELQQKLQQQDAERAQREDVARVEALQTAESATEIASPLEQDTPASSRRRYREDNQPTVFEAYKEKGIKQPDATEPDPEPASPVVTRAPSTSPSSAPKPTPTSIPPAPKPSSMPSRPPKAPVVATPRPADTPKGPEISTHPTSRTTEREKTIERKIEVIKAASTTQPKHDKWLGWKTAQVDKITKKLQGEGIDWTQKADNDPDARVRLVRKWETGPKVVPPEEIAPNQDNILVDRERGLFVIADGMGGHAGGELASKIVVETFQRPQAYDRLSVDARFAASELATNFDIARAKMRDEVKGVYGPNGELIKPGDPNLEGMGAAVVAVQIVNGNQLAIANAGDAMVGVYRASANGGKGRLEWLTTEQGEGNQVYNAVSTRLSKGRAEHNQSSSGKNLDEVGNAILMPGDRVVILSDGVLGDTPDQRLSMAEYKRALEADDPTEAMNRLYRASKKYDDTSIIIFDFEGTTDASEAAKNMPSASEPEKRRFEAISGRLDDDDEKKTPNPVQPTPPTPPPAVPSATVAEEGDKPQFMSPELFNKIALLRAERESDEKEKDILEAVKSDLKRMLEDGDDPSQIDRLADLIGQRRAQESLMFDMLADVQEEETGRRRRKMSKKLVRDSYHNSVAGGEQWVYDEENPDKKPEKKDLPNLDNEINNLKEEIMKGYRRKYKREMKELFAELETIGPNAWEEADIDVRIRQEAHELARDKRDDNADRYEARMRTGLNMNEDQWYKNAEMIQLGLRNEVVTSRGFEMDMFKDMLRSDVNTSPNPAIREARFLKFVTDKASDTGERTPGNEVGSPLSRWLLNEQIDYFLELNNVSNDDPRRPAFKRRLNQMALDFLSAKELAETPQEYLARPQDVDVGKLRRFNTEARGSLRREMNVATAREMMRELYDANRLADEYDIQQRKVRKLESQGVTFPGQLSLARNKLNKLGRRLDSYKAQMGTNQLTRITEG